MNKDKHYILIKQLKSIRPIHVLLVVFAVIYGYRMFAIHPWYDELYTYYSFICRGPIYAGIHWPLPNNHVGYSVLSACLNWTGSPTIALRGVAYFASVLNIYLVYALTRRLLNIADNYGCRNDNSDGSNNQNVVESHDEDGSIYDGTVSKVNKNTLIEALSILSTILYATVNIVHTISVQGRGYSLSTSCFIVSILMIMNIAGISKAWTGRESNSDASDIGAIDGEMTDNGASILEEKDAVAEDRNQSTSKSNTGRFQWVSYVIYAFALVLGIYLVPSSTFWVFPVCVVGGVYLLANKKIKELFKLILASVIAAIMVLGLYTIIWLAIGSNLLSKSAESAFYGIYQLDIIKQAPIKAMQAGIDYMLASPYIQSIPRADVINGLWNYLEALFTQFYIYLGVPMIIYLAVICIFSLVRFIMDRTRFLELFLAVQIFALPLLMIIQCKAPYLRVYTFFGVVVSVSVVWVISLLRIERFKFSQIAVYIFALAVFLLLFTEPYNCSIGVREDNIYETLCEYVASGHEVKEIDSIHYVDDYQQYVLKFYFDAEPVETSLEEANYVMLPTDEMTGVWPFFYSEDSFDRSYVDKYFAEEKRTDSYVIYKRSVLKTIKTGVEEGKDRQKNLYENIKK